MGFAKFVVVFYLGCFAAYGDDHILSRVRRIIGGRELADGEAPYLAFVAAFGTSGGRMKRSIFRSSNSFNRDPTSPENPFNDPEVFCTGTLVNDQWALTAAHCFDGSTTSGVSLRDPSVWRLKLGTPLLSRTAGRSSRLEKSWLSRIFGFKKISNPMFVEIDRIEIHPDYTVDSFARDDVAVVRLREPVSFGPFINNIQLNMDDSYPPDDTLCRAQGWGCTEKDGGRSDVARTVDLPIFDTAECATVVDTEYALCAGYIDMNRGVCSGDSGGPLLCNRNGQLVQVGVTSLSNTADPGNFPGVFLRVSKYINWIRGITE
uniref:Transmembrane protease serine 9-like isoform X2 n=1 Tax=Crassostrea virginica TaxID=6565 RepID=A0A8B8AE12_CRAVI|nr:transmembrane protease serine 9-like isoform X2 [Crassostrea virginica]